MSTTAENKKNVNNSSEQEEDHNKILRTWTPAIAKTSVNRRGVKWWRGMTKWDLKKMACEQEGIKQAGLNKMNMNGF